jgi:hypothetical protein
MKLASFDLSTHFLAFALPAAAFAVAAIPSESRAAPAAQVASAPAAGARTETDSFVVEGKATGAYAAGKEGAVEIVLTAKPGYHVNKEYPYKLKLADAPAGVSFPKPVLGRADGTWEEKKGSFRVPFVAAKAGKYTVAGTFSLSVCSESNCLMDKVLVEVPVEVK